MFQEIELKLEIAEAGIDLLLVSGLLGEDRGESALDATYFDTDDHELKRLGHSLRIRKSGGQTLQTVKSNDNAAGLFTRGEWELPVSSHRPVADSRTPVSDLLAHRRGELLPVFDIVTRRRTFHASHNGAEIEVAVDHAQALTRGRSARFCEVELELKSGKPEALFALARKLDAAAPLRLSVQSKAERGYRLIAALPASVRAEKVQLDPAMSPAAAFAAIAGNCLKQYRLNEAILLDRYVPEAVHQARIGIRRLRSAMVLFKPLIAGPGRDRINEGLRDLAQCLGEARDLDVLTSQAKPGQVLDRLTAARDAAHAAVAARLNAKATRHLLFDITAWIAAGDWRSSADADASLPEFAAASLDRLRHRTAKHGRHFVQLDPEARHAVRKDAKKLRYGIEFLAPLFGHKARRRKFQRALEVLQDDLGALNDRETALERLTSLGLAGTAEGDAFIANWPAEALLERAADERHALLDVKPFWR